MSIVYWAIIIALFIIAFVGLVYPIIPSMLFLLGAYLLYGLFFSFEPLGIFFWFVQVLFALLLLAADQAANIFGVKKFGGSKAGIWGSTAGLLLGPFLIPVAGILLGPFIGALLGEMIVNRTPWKRALKIGVGSVAGFIGSVVMKALIQLGMIGYFLWAVLH